MIMNFRTKFIILVSVWIYSVFASESCVEETANDCSLNIDCSTGVPFSITNEKLFGCTQASIYWSYPRSNMTVKFTYDLRASSTFQLCLTNPSNIPEDIPIYRIVNSQVGRIYTETDKFCLNSDVNNAVVLKFIGPTNIRYFSQWFSFSLNKL